MHKKQFTVADDLAAAVDDLYGKFGVWTMARALVLAAWHRRRTRNRNSITDLDNRMRRDIGLSGEDDLSTRHTYSVWNIRP
jgi:hypothetical protein